MFDGGVIIAVYNKRKRYGYDYMYNKGNFDILYKPINVLTILDQSWLFQNCQVGNDT